MFSGRRFPELLRASGSRQTLIIALTFSLVTLGAMHLGRQLVEDFLLSHVTEQILKDVDAQTRVTHLASTGAVVQAILTRETFDPKSERRAIVVDPDGRVVYGDADLFEQLSDLLPRCSTGLCTPASVALRAARMHILGMRMPLADGGQYVSAYDIRPILCRLRMIPLAIGGGLVTVLLLVMAISVRFGLANLRRVDAIADTLERYAAGHREARVPPQSNRDEFTRLGREINRTLDRISRLVEEVRSSSGHIAHELRTPMTRLQNRLLDIAETEDGPLRAEVLMAVEEIARMKHLVRGILRIGEIETGRCRQNFTRFGAADLLRDVADYYQPLAESRGCPLEVAANAELAAVGDRELLFQAIANLVDNALKYAPEGSPVELHACRRDGALELSVADRGPGIPAAAQTSALQRFVRLDNARGKPGYGLGLSLVNAIAELHRGTLTFADARPGLIAALRLPN